MFIISRTDGSVTGGLTQKDSDSIWAYLVSNLGPDALKNALDHKND